jgi:hypothetical protein
MECSVVEVMDFWFFPSSRHSITPPLPLPSLPLASTVSAITLSL